MGSYFSGHHPITHTNWQGTGVEPDVKVAAALTTAQNLVAKPATPEN